MQTEMTFGARIAATWHVLVEYMTNLTEPEPRCSSSEEGQQLPDAPTKDASS
jgi:hypothetical protein